VKNIDEITELKSGIWKLRQTRREREENVPITCGQRMLIIYYYNVEKLERGEKNFYIINCCV